MRQKRTPRRAGWMGARGGQVLAVWTLGAAASGAFGQAAAAVPAAEGGQSRTGAHLGAKPMAEDGPPPSSTVFPLEDVRPGMKAVAYTVFEGVRPETMEVEILGRLKNAVGPGRDMILARLHGQKPEYTGVVAGMSGSPVYIDGKLLGALSYRIGQFSKEPIAGITPIGQMLEVRDQTMDAPPAMVPMGVTPTSVGAQALPSFGGAEMKPMEAPLVFNGYSEEAVRRFGGAFQAMGLVPVSGLGGVDETKRQDAPLEPGSAVSAVLVDGDLSVTGTCTVSYLDKNRLMACGHPITQSGQVDLPMAKAEVLATLASPLNSFKIVNATEIVGSFTQDRASAIYGTVGGRARLIPVTIGVGGVGLPERTVHLGVANHRELTPQLMLVSVFQVMQQVESGTAEASYKVSGEIRLTRRGAHGEVGEALPPVHVDGWNPPTDLSPGAVNAALAMAMPFQQLFANATEQPVMTGVDLKVEVANRRRSATMESARLLTPEAGPGDEVEVEAVVRPYQQAERVVRTRLRLPKTLTPGTLRLLVSDGSTLDRLLDAPSAHPLGLADAVARLNSVHVDDRVYVSLLDRNAQAVLDAAALTEVPLSMANVLEPLKGSQRVRLSGESVVLLGSMPVDDAVTGSQVLTLQVR